MSSTNAPRPAPRPRASARPAPRGGVGSVLLLVLVAALASGLAAGCDGNPTCVFVDGCRGGGGLGDGGAAARLPEQGEWIVDGAPTIETVLPGDTFVAGTTPVVVVFNESMNLETLQDAFELVPIVNGLEGPPVPLPLSTLVGDGRVLLLFPPTRLEAAEYLVFTSADAELRDITGQIADVGSNVQVGRFAVDAMDPEDMQVVATYPPDASSAQAPTGEIVVVFDRPAQDSTVTSASIQVTIDDEEPPADPDPEAVTVEQGGLSVPDLRAYTWRSVDSDDEPLALPLGGQVLIEVSPEGEVISDSTGAIVQPFVSSYLLLDFRRPLGAALLSQPMDAIGAANLTPGDDEELLIQIDLSMAEEGDFLDLFLFGTSTTEPVRTIAQGRMLELTDPTPIDVAFYDREAADLTFSVDPIDPRFADGALSFAFRLRRGTARSSLTVLDVDPDTDGIQDPLLDTTGPMVLEFFFAGGVDGTELRSDQRDIVVGGRADEFVRAAEVVSETFGDNGVLPGVTGVDEEGLFVAAPIEVGVLPPGDVTLDLVAYDAAFNASDPLSVTYRQLGAVGPGPFAPGDMLTVEVFDARTLEPIEDALVLTHGDEDDETNYPFVDSALTDAEGRAMLATAGAPSVAALVTVDALGYDLFTFHGVSSARVSIPLETVGSGASATVSGEVSTSDPEASFLLNLLERRMGDSRRPEDAFPLYAVDDCQTDPFGTGRSTCPYGPEPIRPGRLGVQTFLAGSFMQSAATLSIEALLQAFDIRFPLDLVAPGDASMSFASIPYLLSDPDAGPEESPTEFLGSGGSFLDLVVLSGSGVDVDDLVGDPGTSGDPFVTVEGISPGFPGSFPVGVGVSFPAGASTWDLRAAFAGAVGVAGFFGSNGLVDPDVFLRAEVRDASGNRVSTRLRTSRIEDLPFGSSTLVPLGVPALAAPAPGGNSGGSSFDLEFSDPLFDLYGMPGLYRATLEDEGGRRWRLWRFDGLNTVDNRARIHVPDLAAGGASGLGDGTIRATIAVFGVPGLVPTEFLWSDLAREHEHFSEGAQVTFQQP